MTKLKSKRQLQSLIKKAKRAGKTVGLVTGSFTQIVENHELLFKFAKTHTDILIVCTGNDAVVCSIKKCNFPIFSERIAALEQFESIDYIFEIQNIDTNVTEPVIAVYKQLITDLEPDFIFTNGLHDKYLGNKRKATIGTGVRVVDRSDSLNFEGNL